MSEKESILIHAIKYASIRNELKIGNFKIKKILEKYKSLEKFFDSEISAEKNNEDFNIDFSTEELLKLIDIEHSYKRLKKYQESGMQITNICSKDYPKRLRQLFEPPPIIYYYGDLKTLDYHRSISIVGTRKASLYGKKSTRAVVNALAEHQPTIVSGLAMGIDSEAHITAIQNEIPTVAILGFGLENANATKFRNTYQAIKKHPRNLIISEFEPYQAAERWTFPARNRLIAALSKITVVVEAGNKSGALITARFAKELKRKIYAVPGEVDKYSFSGSNQLIASAKAQPLYSVEQLYSDLNIKKIKEKPKAKAKKRELIKSLDISSQEILKIISKGSMNLDKLKLELNSPNLLAKLSILEAKGLLIKSANGIYAKK